MAQPCVINPLSKMQLKKVLILGTGNVSRQINETTNVIVISKYKLSSCTIALPNC